jgi:hypothetical protein
MAIRLNVPARNGILDSGLNALFNAGTLCIYSGTQPATANLAPTGTLLAEITLPADAFAPASAGSIAKSGTWQDASANAAGTAGYFRFKAAGDNDTLDGNFSRIDGSVTATGGGGDMTLDNTSIAAAQSVTVNTFSFTMPAS